MRFDETEHFDRDGFSGDVYVSDENKKEFNALRVSVHGKHPLKKMVDATRVYFVIEGKGTFTMNGTTNEVKEHDLYVIEPGSEYEYEGTMTLFEFNVPIRHVKQENELPRSRH